MISTATLTSLADKISSDSVKHGYIDHDWPSERTMTKAICELGEAVNAYRDNHNAGLHSFLSETENIIKEKDFADYPSRFKATYDRYIKNSVQDELADAAIYTLLAAQVMVGTDIPADFEACNEDDIIASDPYFTGLFKGSIFDFMTIIGHIIRLMADSPSIPNCLRIIRHIETFMRLFYNQELEVFIIQKMQYNEYRPFRHGRKYDPTI